MPTAPPPSDRDRFVAHFTAPGVVPLVPEVVLAQADGVIELWDTVRTELHDETIPPPFWAFAWAGGQALARFVIDHPELVRGRRVLDFACGSGLVGIAAALAGARAVRCVDIDPFAVAATRANAERNGVSIEVDCADVLGSAVLGVDVVLAGDVFYERGFATRVTPWLRALAMNGAHVFAGDPDRNYPPADGYVAVARYTVPVSTDLEGRQERTATIWQAATRSAGS